MAKQRHPLLGLHWACPRVSPRTSGSDCLPVGNIVFCWLRGAEACTRTHTLALLDRRMQASWQSEARDTEASSLAASAALSGTGAAMGASASSAAPAPAASAAPSAAAPASALSRVPDVDLDADGTFKYVMLTLSDPATGESKSLVRG